MSHNETIAHYWVHDLKGGKYNYKSYKMGYIETELYSYNSRLATIDRTRKIVTVDKCIANSSVTSKRHYWQMLRAIPSDYKIFMNPHPELPKLAGYLEEILDLIDKSTRARSIDYIIPAIELIDEAMSYVTCFKCDKRSSAYKALNSMSKNKENLLEASADIITKDKAQKAKEIRRRNKRRQKARQEQLDTFLGHSDITYDPEYKGVYLKVENDKVKTSNRMTVPLRESQILYKRYLLGSSIVGLRLGSFRVLESSSKGVTVGCTFISAEELNRVFKGE